MHKIYTKWDRPSTDVELEHPRGESMTETAGYQPAKAKIESFIAAGKRLEAYRKELYSYESEEQADKGHPDPTRSGDWDLADFTATQQELQERFIQQQQQQRELKEQESLTKVKEKDEKSEENEENEEKTSEK